MMESHAGRYEGEGFHDYRLSMEDYSTLVTINRDPRTRRAVAALQETLAPGHGVTELQRAFESRDVSRDGFLTRAHMQSPYRASRARKGPRKSASRGRPFAPWTVL